MSKWNKSLFNSLEEAHITADKMELSPSSIAEKDEIASFYIYSEGKKILIAQKITGGPVLEKNLGKCSGWQQGWLLAQDCTTLEEILADYKHREEVSSTVYRALIVEQDVIATEYVQVPEGVLFRTIYAGKETSDEVT